MDMNELQERYNLLVYRMMGIANAPILTGRFTNYNPKGKLPPNYEYSFYHCRSLAQDALEKILLVEKKTEVKDA